MAGTRLSRARLDGMRRVMSGHVERGTVPGLVTLVARGDELHVDAIGARAIGGAPMTRDTIFRVASFTKPVAAVAAMILVEACRLRLDDPVDAWLPELADRRVLRRLDGPLDDTVPAHRPITLRDLLTLRMGLGHIMAPCDDFPIRRRLTELGLLLGPPQPQSPPPPDEWMRRLGAVPLMHQPGEGWMYDIAADVLGVLIARASGQPLEHFLEERIFAPLGMTDTGFHVPEAKVGRLATSYAQGPDGLEIYDPAEGGQWTRAPSFPMASGGLVSTVDDYLLFARMMLNHGRHGRERILSRPSIALMTSDQLTAPQRRDASPIVGENRGWGFGLAVVTRRDEVSASPGRFGWDGGLGTSWAADPAEDMVAILLSQVAWTSPSPPVVYLDFWTSAYQAIED